MLEIVVALAVYFGRLIMLGFVFSGLVVLFLALLDIALDEMEEYHDLA